jgi:membrane fusion protein, copper/silver efflux system
VTLVSPVSGFVTAKSVFEGHQVEPGMELYTVTDLSRVWIEAEFYEYESQAVRPGQEATISLPYDPGQSLQGRVSYIAPYLNPDTRTLQVRFDVPNADLLLKPSMFVDVLLTLRAGESVVVPDSAVMDSGMRQIVFVDRGDGSFEPREVKIGLRSGGKTQVLSGVNEGEEVVVRANFLLDSESRLQSAIGSMSTGHETHAGGGAP